MGKGKRDKYKEKMEKRNARTQGLTPKPTMVPLLMPAFENMVERHDVLKEPIIMAMTRLRIGRGSADDFATIFGRLYFGRILAEKYFTEQVAKSIHDAVVIVCGTAHKQPESDRMRIYPADLPTVDAALDAITGMVKKTSYADYKKTTLEVGLVLNDHDDADSWDQFAVSWEEYKLNQSPIVEE